MGKPGHNLDPVSLLARFVRGSVQVDDDLCTGSTLNFRWPARFPDVLTNVDANLYPADREYRAFVPGGEVTTLIEHTVVWKVDFPIGSDDFPLMQHGSRIEQLAIFGLHESDQCHDVTNHQGDLAKRRPVRGNEVVVEDEVFRRITGYCQFREGDEIGTLLLGQPYPLLDQPRIAIDIANRGVYLGCRYSNCARRSRTADIGSHSDLILSPILVAATWRQLP